MPASTMQMPHSSMHGCSDHVYSVRKLAHVGTAASLAVHTSDLFKKVEAIAQLSTQTSTCLISKVQCAEACMQVLR